VALVAALLAFGGGSDASLEAVQAGLGGAVAALLSRQAGQLRAELVHSLQRLCWGVAACRARS
jgi:hypothetical protein